MPSILELGQKVKAKYPGQYDDMDDHELGMKVKTKYPDAYGDFSDDEAAAPDTAMAASPSPAATPVPEQQGLHVSNEMVRGAGGMLGGMMAGAELSPAAAAAGSVLGPVGTFLGGVIPPIAGAALGGGAIEMVREHLKRMSGDDTPETPSDDPIAAMRDQAMYELGGQLLMRPLQAAGKGMMQVALKAAPDIAKTAIAEGISATGKGLETLNARWKEIVGAERSMAMNAGRNGVRIPGYTMADEAYKQVKKQLRGADTATLKELSKLHNDFVAQWGGSIRPSSALAIRKWSDRVANGLWKAREGGKLGIASVREMWSEAMGNQSRDFLRSRVPEVNNPAVYEKLFGRPTTPAEITRLKLAVEPIVKKHPTIMRSVLQRAVPTAAGAGVGAAMSPEHRATGAMAGAAIGAGAGFGSAPQVMSHGGLLLNNPILGILLRNAPRLAGTAQ